jgi:hypothetical protein
MVWVLAFDPTCPKVYSHWAALLCRASNPQLAIVVPSPALDAAPGHDGTRLVISRGDGDGANACKGRAECEPLLQALPKTAIKHGD